MRVIFAGTPQFAVPAFESLVAAGHDVVLVLTQPDRPSGRGLGMAASPVKRAALARGIEVFQPASLKSAHAQARLRAAGADVMVVAAYGLILPQAVLDLPRRGALNIHASLLPRWRGAAPIQRAILAGDLETGVCIMQMDAGLDTGAVLLQAVEPITADDTAGSVQDRLASIGARLVVVALDGLEHGILRAMPQPATGATYAPKLEKAEARLDWSRSADEIARQVRAFNPAPGATATLDGTDLKIWRAAPLPRTTEEPPGTVIAVDPAGVDVVCGKGTLRILELQRAGGKRLSIGAFVRGSSLAAGARFGPGQ